MTDAAVDDGAELVDDDGYPTEAGLTRLREFHGSPRQLVDLLEAMWWQPSLISVDEILDEELRAWCRVSLATGGWSGNETIIATLVESTVFHLRFWESVHRGGLHIYEVPQTEWDAVGKFGKAA